MAICLRILIGAMFAVVAMNQSALARGFGGVRSVGAFGGAREVSASGGESGGNRGAEASGFREVNADRAASADSDRIREERDNRERAREERDNEERANEERANEERANEERARKERNNSDRNNQSERPAAESNSASDSNSPPAIPVGAGFREVGGFERGPVGREMRAAGIGGVVDGSASSSDGNRGAGVGGFRDFSPGRAIAVGGDRMGGSDRSVGFGFREASPVARGRPQSLPTDAGLHDVGGTGGPGVGNGFRWPRSAGGADEARQFQYSSPAMSRAQGWEVRRGFNGSGWYSRDWYDRYPGCWRPSAWYRGTLGSGAWAYCTWPYLGAWFDYGAAPPINYNYGDNFTYNGGNVYFSGQRIGSAAQYYAEIKELAESGPEPDPNVPDWLPLGVFALVERGQNQPSLVFQLAVNKDAAIRGNCSKPDGQFVGIVNGGVNEDRQLAAWIVGDDKETIYETGLYNFTKDEAPALVHRGPNRTEQWLMVRMRAPDAPQPAGANR